MASMKRAGSGPKKEGWRRVRTLMFAPPVVLITIATIAFLVAMLVGLPAALRTMGIHTNRSVAAFLLGFFIAAFLGVIWYFAAVVTGGASSFMGASAERWTERELLALGPAWRLFHNLVFQEGPQDNPWQVDIDHVAVGPYGVLVVESKYVSRSLDLSAIRLVKSVRYATDQATSNSGRITALLHRDAPDAPVVPIVVFWGRLVKHPVHAVRKVDAVRVVSGNDASRWRPLIETTTRMSSQSIDLISEKIARYASNHPAC